MSEISNVHMVDYEDHRSDDNNGIHHVDTQKSIGAVTLSPELFEKVRYVPAR